jgi:hypothetical protein
MIRETGSPAGAFTRRAILTSTSWGAGRSTCRQQPLDQARRPVCAAGVRERLRDARCGDGSGTLAANGGGGCAGTSNGVGSAPPQDPGGANATARATAAAGGKQGVGPSSGGNGSAGTSIDGTAGALTVGNNDAAGGGGGGAGRIRINTKTAQVTLSGTISPAMTAPCATQGMVR